jgi:hypothetical protein
VALAAVLGATCGDSLSSRNQAPQIISLTPSTFLANIREEVQIIAIVTDADGDTLTSVWQKSGGSFLATSRDTARWMAPDTAGAVTISLSVRDGKGGQALDQVRIDVANRPPVIQRVVTTPQNVFVSNPATLRVTASDPDDQPLQVTWNTLGAGTLLSTAGDSARWSAPTTPGTYPIIVTVRDPALPSTRSEWKSSGRSGVSGSRIRSTTRW